MKCPCGADATRTVILSEQGSQTGVRVLTLIRHYCHRCADTIRTVATDPSWLEPKLYQRQTRKQ